MNAAVSVAEAIALKHLPLAPIPSDPTLVHAIRASPETGLPVLVSIFVFSAGGPVFSKDSPIWFYRY